MMVGATFPARFTDGYMVRIDSFSMLYLGATLGAGLKAPQHKVTRIQRIAQAVW